MSYKFHIAPRDLLFLRDARPMEAYDAGLGANWPRPDQIWNAFINAFHRRWPEVQSWEHQHRKNDNDKNKDSSFRFGALKTTGPFPVDNGNGEIFFPCPLDLSIDDEILHPMRLVDGAGTNLPAPLKLAFASVKLGKNESPAWISGNNYARYLNGESFKQNKLELYDTERNIGIGIDSETRSTVEGKLYQAEYLRFRKDTRMAVQVSCDIIGKDREKSDVFSKIADEENIPLIIGGQQGVANVYRHEFALPENVISGNSLRLRWTLLSPAVFPEIKANAEKNIKQHFGGWLPNWIDQESGQVMLLKNSVERQPGEAREQWRQRIKNAEKIAARLVAARIGKPMAFSGWDLQTSGPKPTRLAVPAGSVYIFECDTPAERKFLADALAWNGGSGSNIVNRRSTLFGEKGFGLGVCSTYNQ